MNLQFELLREEDIPRIGGSPEHIKLFLSEKQNVAFVAKLEEEVIGLIYGYSLTRMDDKAPQFFIYSVGIYPAYQDKGCGSRFVQFVVDWARENGFGESFVITDRDNPRACRVYEKAGMAHSENDCDRTYVVEYNTD